MRNITAKKVTMKKITTFLILIMFVFVVHAMAITPATTVVTTAGTKVLLGGNVWATDILIKAAADNAGVVWVGDSTVNAANKIGYPIAAGAVCIISFDNLSRIYLDSDTDAQRVSFIYSE